MNRNVDEKDLVAVDICCARCSSVYTAHVFSYMPGQLTVTIFYGCSCGSIAGYVIGPSNSDEEWPEIIDA